MNWSKIDRTIPDFNFFNPNYLIGNQDELYNFLSSSSNVSIEQFKQIYILLQKDLNLSSVSGSLEEIRNLESDVDNVKASLPTTISSIHEVIETENQPLYIHRISVPQVVKRNYTVPQKILFYDESLFKYYGIGTGGKNYGLHLFTASFEWWWGAFKEQFNKMANKPQAYQNYPISFTLGLIQPPNLIRYVNRRVTPLQVIHPSLDMGQYYIGTEDNALCVVCKNNITIKGNEKDKHLWYTHSNFSNKDNYQDRNVRRKIFAYPSVQNFQFYTLLENWANIRKLNTTHEHNQCNLFANSQLNSWFRSLVTSSQYSDTFLKHIDYLSYTKYLKLNYEDSNIKNLGYQYTLQDKLGYYNSLIPNELFIYPTIFSKLQNSPDMIYTEPTIGTNSIKHAWYTTGMDKFIFKDKELTNILAIVQNNSSDSELYGYMHEAGDYKVSFRIKYSTLDPLLNVEPFSQDKQHLWMNSNYSYNDGNSNLLTWFNNHSKTKYYWTLNDILQQISSSKFQVRIVPKQGLKNFKFLQSNEHIIIAEKKYFQNEIEGYDSNSNYYLMPGISTDRKITFNYPPRAHLSDVYFPSRYYNSYSSSTPLCQEVYSASVVGRYWNPNSNPTTISLKITENYLSPRFGFSQFNFMYDQYGQFLTYRTLNERYFSWNSQSYYDIFSNPVNYEIVQEEDHWFKVGLILRKKFQGNSSLAFLKNKSLDELVSQSLLDIFKISVKDISIQLIW